MFNRKLLLGLFFAIVLVGVLYTVIRSKEPSVELAHDSPIETKTTQSEDTDTNASVLEPHQEKAALAQLSMPPGQAMKKFRKARNEWFADPNLSPETKEKLVKELAYALWGEEAIPEETAEDLEEQARIREEILLFQANAETIKNNTDLTLDEKKKALNILVNQFTHPGQNGT